MITDEANNSVTKKVCAIISTKVDDIKGCASKEWLESFTKGIEKAFGKPTV